MRALETVLALYPPPFPPKADGTPSELTKIQIEDIHTMAEYGRLLGDFPVGYGKTALSTYASLMLEPDATVILVPPILVPPWVAWLKAVGLPGVMAYEGGPAARRLLQIARAKWIVSSYGMWRNDLDRFNTEMSHMRVLTVVDEAQALKNHKSKIFKAVWEFAGGRNLFLMTGTPKSSPADTYAYVKLNTPEVYKTNARFEAIHVEKRDFYDVPTKWHNLDIMQTNFNLKRVHRTVEEVNANLPAPKFIPIMYDLDAEHMALYKKLMTEQLLEVPEGKIDATTANTLHHQAQQIITAWGEFDPEGKPRVSKVFEIMDEICDQLDLGAEGASKLICWTQYKRTSRAVLQHFEKRLGKIGKRAVGAWSETNAKKSVDAFMTDPYTVELTAQPGSAGAGLNPQYNCWACFYFELPTRTIPFTQSYGRIYRTGQKYHALIYLPIARGTIQEGLLAKLMKNDAEVSESSGTKTSVRDLIFPK